MAKGVKSITGNASPEVGEKNFYEVSSFYQGTVIKNENEIKWKLYTQQSSGNWRELRGPQKTGKKVPFSFPEKWLGKKLLIEAFVYNPEIKSPPGLIVTPKTAKIPRINKVELFYVDDKKGSVFSFMEKLRARAYCVNMFLKELTFTLWEDDVKGGGHNTSNKPIDTLKARVDKNGVAVVEFPLSKAIMKKAMEGEVDVKQLEFYVTVEYYKNKKHSTENVDVDNPNPKVPINPPKKTEPKQPPKAKGSPAESKPKSKKEEKGILDKIEEKWDELWDWWETPGTIKKEQQPTVQKPDGRSTSVVNEPVKKEKENEKICECEAKVRAFMRMLRVKEGTSGESGYTKLFGHSNFTKPPHNRDLSTHPDISIPYGTTSSDAAGAYQIMGDTFKNLTGYFQDKYGNWKYSEKLDKKKKYNIKSFDQESQDKFCLAILKHNYTSDRNDSFYNPIYWINKKKIRDTKREEKARIWRSRFKGKQGDIIQFIIDDNVERAILLASLCWASLPDSPYGQQSASYTNAMVKSIYEAYLKQELIEPNSELHLKKGFLKEFGYGCCGDSSLEETEAPQNSVCPEDCSQCFEYADVIPNPKVNDQSGNKNHNRYKNEPRTKSNGKKYYHSGTDILAVVGTEVHTMMCGEVVHIRKDLPQNNYSKGYESPSSYGNTITIKSKDKTGKIVYHFYAHLSQVNVKVGETVKHNKVIGLSGSTGNAMHVEVRHRHVHVEAGTSYSTTGGSDGKQRCKIKADLNPENYMKSKFDKKGNTL